MPAAGSRSTGKGILLRDKSHFGVLADLTNFVPFDCLQSRRSGQALRRWQVLKD
jgi:hypothetical protein